MLYSFLYILLSTMLGNPPLLWLLKVTYAVYTHLNDFTEKLKISLQKSTHIT